MADFHRFGERINKALIKLDNVSGISDRNKDIIRKFINEARAQCLSDGRIYKLFYFSISLARLLNKDFDQADKEDIKELIRKIESDPKKYTENTKKDFKVITKKLYKWLKGNNENYPDEVCWIKTTIKKHKRKLPEDLLTPEEIRNMINAADNPRDKAYVFVGAEAGYRWSEGMSLSLKSVSFDPYGASIIVTGKTGPRKIRLIMSVDYLRNWMENHPDRKNPNAPLWVGIGNYRRGSILSYQTMRKRLRQIGTKAGIPLSKLHFHNFRHSRASQLASKLSTSNLCQMFGWEMHSSQVSTYISLSLNSSEDALLKVYGIKKENGIEMLNCPRCQRPNPPMTKYCSECGQPFNIEIVQKEEETRANYDRVMDKLMEDEEFRRIVRDRMKEIRF